MSLASFRHSTLPWRPLVSLTLMETAVPHATRSRWLSCKSPCSTSLGHRVSALTGCLARIFREIHRERLALASSMRDLDGAVRRLDSILVSVVVLICILILTAMVTTKLTTLVTSAGTFLLGLSWLIGRLSAGSEVKGRTARIDTICHFRIDGSGGSRRVHLPLRQAPLRREPHFFFHFPSSR